MKRATAMLISLGLLANFKLSSETATEKKAHPKVNIVMCGSSTVWGKGLLDDSFVAPVNDFVKNELSATIPGKNMIYKKDGKRIKPEILKNRKQYNGNGFLISGKGTSVEFDISGDELAICQTIRRTKDWGKMDVYADGKLIGSFNNKNTSLGSGSATFTGDGKKENFELDKCFTYNHKVKINNKDVNGGLHTQGAYMKKDIFEYYPKDFEYAVIRKYSEEKPVKVVHSLLFKKAPPKDAKIEIRYDYGEMICHTKCTVGESKDGKLESTFGAGKVAHDPAHPTRISTGLDYRHINPEAFFIHKFKTAKKRHIKIVVEGGDNPYFVVDFAGNRFHNLMNAGIGGWTAKNLLNDKYLRNYKEACKAFKPDIFFIALGGNDDWAEKKRYSRRTLKNITEENLKNMPSLDLHSAKYISDNNFTVEKNTGLIDEITETSLTSSQLKGEKIKSGFFVKIGNYTGDNNSVAVRTIKTFNPESGRIIWEKPLKAEEILCVNKLEDLKGADVAVRDLKFYGQNLRELVKRLRKINPEMTIVFLNVYNTNFFTRPIWGYPELQKIIAAEHKNVYTVNAAKTLQDFQMNNISGKEFLEIEADASKEYTLPWQGHRQGYKVWVNGKNVYGKDCYILSGRLWALDSRKKGKSLEFIGNYTREAYKKRNQKLVFLRNAPKSGTIRVEKADVTWSYDFAHPAKHGIKVIGAECNKKIKEILNL
jgi:lysophospholipase L1-like esterase